MNSPAPPPPEAAPERIAGMLGVRREGVSVAVLKLQREGLIHCGRGRIQALDRRALEQHSCECYGVVQRAYDQLRNGSPAWPHAADALDPMPASRGRLMSQRVPPAASARAQSTAR